MRRWVTLFAGVVLLVSELIAGSFHLTQAEPRKAVGPISVVATIPVLKDLADHVGGRYVRVVSLLSGMENEHTYSPRPSDIIAVRNARVLLEVGVGLEVWVASLVKNAGNKALRVVTTSKGIALIRDYEPESMVSQAPGKNQHAGNPHVWLDPENAKIMMRHITEAFIKVDPDHASDYRENQAAYLRQLDQLQSELAERLRPLSDRRIIVHHPAWPYFARRFGFRVADEIVTQAGAEPSANHLHALITRMQKDRIRVIVSEPQLNQKIPQVLARETGAQVVMLTPLPGGIPGTETYLDMLRYDVMQLAKALEAS
ncbi:MAG TPA: metal ABC transporter substrate-binding protein [Nitrospiraceae bacterium]|nr:metal ABC transporter substrate-binding protein [Nitrospiraceae bacterium]